MRTRFAPSPTGQLHVGNARTALLAWLHARASAGAFVLRMEDTDVARSTDQSAQGIMQSLRTLGIIWDEGPDIGGPYGSYRQRERTKRHAEHYKVLLEKNLAYPCFCSEAQLNRVREAQRRRGEPPRYPGTCRDLTPQQQDRLRSQGLPEAMRMRMGDDGEITFDDMVAGPQSFQRRNLGDFLIRKSDGTPTFQFANAVDDADMGIDLAIRGQDHLSNTPRQLHVLRSLGLPDVRYAHLPLLTDASGRPLSKRQGGSSIDGLLEAGYLPQAIVHYLAHIGTDLKEPDEDWSLSTLAAEFQKINLGTSAAVFDIRQLARWNKRAVLRLSHADLAAWVSEHAGDVLPTGIDPHAFWDVIKDNTDDAADVKRWATTLFAADDLGDDLAAVLTAAGPQFFEAAAHVPAATTDWSAFTKAVSAATGARGRGLYQPLRVAIQRAMHGPDLGMTAVLLGDDVVRQRLVAAAAASKPR